MRAGIHQAFEGEYVGRDPDDLVAQCLNHPAGRYDRFSPVRQLALLVGRWVAADAAAAKR